MNRYSPIIVALLWAWLCASPLLAQEKFERESRIDRKDVPADALGFLDGLGPSGRVRWYMEEGLNRKSIEAKFRLDGARCSVEFDTLGHVEDVEVETDWESLNASVRDSITAQLTKDCSKHRVGKVQVQYTGMDAALLAKLRTGQTDAALTVHYEMMVRCDLPQKVELFEYLFSGTGGLVSASRVVFKNSSHLEY
jgi:hypothetical protein